MCQGHKTRVARDETGKASGRGAADRQLRGVFMKNEAEGEKKTYWEIYRQSSRGNGPRREKGDIGAGRVDAIQEKSP